MAASGDSSLRVAVAALGGAGEAVVVAEAGHLLIVAANDTALALLDSEPYGHHLAWLLPECVAGDLRQRVESLLAHGGRSISLATRPRWEIDGGVALPVRLDLVEREGRPFVVAFIRDSPEDRAARPAHRPSSPLAALNDRDRTLDRIDAEVRRAYRHGRGLALVHVRVTGRAIAGDDDGDALIAAARRLRDATRADETFGRCAQDAFVWILHETDLDGALVAAERAHHAVLGDRSRSDSVVVGAAGLRHGETAEALLRRAEQETLALADGNPRNRDEEPAADTMRLLRTTATGDVRALRAVLADIERRRGVLTGHDRVTLPAVQLLTDAGVGSANRRTADHRALWLIESALVGRELPAPPDGAPVVAVMPFGCDVRRAMVHVVVDAALSAGWAPVVVEIPPGMDAPGVTGAMGATAVIPVVGGDSDLVAVSHLVEDFRERGAGELVAVASAPGTLLEDWSPPPPARSLGSARAVAAALGGPAHAEHHGAGGPAAD